MPAQYLSMQQLADMIGVPRHRVRYVLRERRIEPRVAIGDVPGYDQTAAIQVRAELAGILNRR